MKASEVFYKVLWVDDLAIYYDKDIRKETSYCISYKSKAENYNIILEPFDNWEEAEYELRRNFDEYSAVILDAYCKIHKNDSEQEEFITAALPSLTNLFGEKRRLLPWFILSEGTMSNFGKVVNGALYQHAKHEEDWGRMHYIKNTIEDGATEKDLFKNIARIAKDMAMNVVLYRHQDTFRYLGKDKLIDEQARKLLLRMLSALYYPEENIGFEYKGNPLRQVLEYLFWSALKHGLLPEECIGEDKEGKRRIVVQLASLFMAGKNVVFSKNGNDSSKVNVTIRWGKAPSKKDGDDGDAIFPTEIKEIVNNIRIFTNEESHASEDEPWFIDEERKDIFFGYVLQMCHVIRWYGKYIEKHGDYDENIKMINLFGK